MRTTVTIDPDVERLLKDAVRRTGSSFKEVLNRAVREGLAAAGGARRLEPYRIQARPMGLRPGLDPGSLNSLADELATEDFVEPSGRS